MYLVHMLRRLGVWFSPIRERIAPASLSILGLAAFTTAGFTINDTIGWVVAGASALLLEFRINDGGQVRR